MFIIILDLSESELAHAFISSKICILVGES